ncbi:MAG TPA: hypothetical protein VG253_29035 [Streptosporangiaceae bacterium]|nr:hypothetical protein [Streptosporangiaceae bacterium]
MPVDYATIRDENIARYGWDTAVLDLLGQLYSERTHFIFELIQNAEDAGATRLSFDLFSDRLEVRHDGRPFNEADVRGLCGVAKSGKSGDLTKIGQFGIGFKSVYAYTRTPRIHSSGEHFRIENFVRPFPEAPPDEPSPGTLFVFPFDHDSVSAATAIQEISAALDNLDLDTLLFLKNIESLQIRGAGVAESSLERVTKNRKHRSRQVGLVKRDGGGETVGEHDWLVWHRQLGDLGHRAQQVEIAFRLTNPAKGERRIVGHADSPLVVFFPTQKQTFLGFLIQGPYRTTPARDNVPQDDPSNKALVQQTATLLADVLLDLRDEGILTADVLRALPLDAAHFAPGTMFRPLFESARAVFAAERVIPVAGGYGAAGELRLTGGSALRELLTPEQLGSLYGAGRPLAFADESITPAATPVAWRYLQEEIGMDALTPTALVARATGEFLAAQSDEWTARFYAFLHVDGDLWRAPRFPGEQPGPARAKPIIRLEDGSHIAPFDSGDRPAAYLPGPAHTGLRTVRRAVADVPAARQFLEALSFTEPDVVAEVTGDILPRYARLDDVADLDPAQHDADLEAIVRALAEADAGRRQDLVDQLHQTAFLIGENAATGDKRLMTPPSLYQRTKDLEIYFDQNPGAWFAADSYGPWLPQLRTMGVRSAVELCARKAGELGHVVVAEEFARHERGIAGFDPGAEIDGLDFAVRNPRHARSEYVWNTLLVPNRHLVAGIVEKSVREQFTDATRENTRSAIGVTASGAAWLPGPDGTFHRPAELSLDHLPATYQRDEPLARGLGMSQPVVAEAARQLGVPPDVLWGLSAYPELVAGVQRELKARAAAGPRAEGGDGERNAQSALSGGGGDPGRGPERADSAAEAATEAARQSLEMLRRSWLPDETDDS